MGWFYGFKLHIICNTLMQILRFRITSGNTDDRKGLERMWNMIFGLIIADAGYLGKNWQKKAINLGKHLFTAVKANMKKIMTEAQHQLLNLRQRVETVFSVLKVRLGFLNITASFSAWTLCSLYLVYHRISSRPVLCLSI